MPLVTLIFSHELDFIDCYLDFDGGRTRETPTQKKSEKEPPKQHKRYNLKKLTYDERKASLIERLNALNAAAGADEEVDDEDDE
ncbi:hypothetical protein ACSBR1_030743 [Camellia fascicularis]